ncbi:uncharacterized protein LOC129302201 isoform X2 [Prosopis cineraria]|uniref:uncharacterized protein LOC129302201 isoform X2 n=1 Tax=Prosopis cineraria TaxID=364024 RepID=UPI00240F0AF5|nr:uncharacterized protein LOC129302201 isoform X2 [Prosopis cineraria]
MVQVVGGMAELTKLCLQSCKKIDCLIDSTNYHATSFQADALLPKLIKLEISEMNKLSELCRGPPILALGFFKKLEQLFIGNCKQLYNIFPETCNLCNLKILKIWNRHSSAIASLFSMSVARSMEQLEELWIQGCDQLRHIITGEGGNGTSTGENSHTMFHKLKKFSICDCPKLEFIFPISFVQNGLLQLQEIEIESTSGQKHVFGQYDHEVNASHQNQVQIMLPPLKVFYLYNVENLLGICPESYHLGFPSLEELDCQRCPKLTASCISIIIGSEQRHMNNGVSLDNEQQNHLTSNLQQLLLGGLSEVRFIWSGPAPRPVLSFKFLQCLKVENCANLKSIFSTVINRSLPELTLLSICNCEELEEIMAENAEPESLSNIEVCFPKLSELRIEKCNKLKSLFHVAMIRMLPQLSFIHVSCAAQLEEAFQCSSEGNSDYGDQVMLPELRKIELQNLPSFGNIFKGFNFQAPKVQQLYISKCPEFSPSVRRGTQVTTSHNTTERQVFWLIVATCNLEAFLSLEVLHVTKSREEGIFQIQAAGELSSNSELKPLNSNLGYLTLYDLPELKFIWNGFSKFLSLDKLTHVSIQKCPKVKTIFSLAFIRCLPKLQSLSVSNCEELEEIISLNSEDAQISAVHIPEVSQSNKVYRHGSEDRSDSQDEIILPDLRKIELKKLPSFANIFHGFNFQTPKLQQLYVDRVPKFAQRGTHMNTLHYTKEKRQIFWLITKASNEQWKQRHRAALQASLNLEVLHLSMCQAEGIFQGEGELGSNSELKPLNSNLEYLKLCDLPELRFIWKGLKNFLSLEKLTRVSISSCPKLKTICSPSIVRCLPKLHSLRISNCAELEEIMSSNSMNAQLSHPYVCHQQVCFPQLSKITVEQCNKLKCIFNDLMAYHLPELQSLEIKDCCQMERVLRVKTEDLDGKQTLFPKLTKLVLESLPMFFEILPGLTLPPGFNLQPWHEYVVMDCPKYNHAYTEASTSYLDAIPEARRNSQPGFNQNVRLGLKLAWNPPCNGWITIKVDGAFDEVNKIAGCGGLIRDHNGNFVHGFMHHIGRGNSLNAQLWACIMGLKGAWDAGFRRAILETDSLQVVRLFGKDVQERFLAEAEEELVYLIFSMLGRNWKVWLAHRKPEGNVVADLLAKLALQAWPGYHYFNHPPKQVEKLVLEEARKPLLM